MAYLMGTFLGRRIASPALHSIRVSWRIPRHDSGCPTGNMTAYPFLDSSIVRCPLRKIGQERLKNLPIQFQNRQVCGENHEVGRWKRLGRHIEEVDVSCVGRISIPWHRLEVIRHTVDAPVKLFGSDIECILEAG